MNVTPAILVVDDQPELLDSIATTLEAAGYTFLGAGDGLEGLAQLKNQIPDLIIADIAMPRMNGYQFYEQVRQNPALIHIPFIFLTARGMDSDIRYGKELGVDDYLTKPIQPEDLLAVVKGKLRRAQQLTQANPSWDKEISNTPSALVVGPLKIENYRVWYNGEEIKFSAREIVLLEYLAGRAEQVISPQELLKVTHQLETDAIEAGSLIRPLIRTIRRKLGFPAGDMGCIENVRGVGYRYTLK